MIVIRTVMNVLPEKQKEVLQTLLSLTAPPTREGGCLSYLVFNDIEDRNSFHLISEWDTRNHLENHIKSDKFSVLLGIRSLLCEPLRIDILTVSGSEGIEAVYSLRRKADLAKSKRRGMPECR